MYWENVEVPMKCNNSLPLHLNREVPSGMTPLPWVARILPQRFVLPDLQNLHSPHSGVLKRQIVSSATSCFNIRDILECHNVVSRLHIRHTFTNRLDDSSAFMTKNYWERPFGILPRECVCIYTFSAYVPCFHGLAECTCMTDSSIVDLYPDFVCFWCLNFDVLN